MCTSTLVLCVIALALSILPAAAEPRLSMESNVSTQPVSNHGTLVGNRSVMTNDIRMSYPSGIYLREESSFGAGAASAVEFASGFSGGCFFGISCDADVGYRFLPGARAGVAALRASAKKLVQLFGGRAELSASLEETMPNNAARERKLDFAASYARIVGGIPLRLAGGAEYDRTGGGITFPATVSATFPFPDVPRLSLTADAGVIALYERTRAPTSFEVGLHLHYAW